VRKAAAKVLGGLAHSGFLDATEQMRLLDVFRAKIRTTTTTTSTSRHSGVLGLCSLVEAHPYKVPDFVPAVLVELERHLHDPQPVPETVKRCLREFRRTHQDRWSEHRAKFSAQQLDFLADLLVSPNYYA
jgi:proteasome activator subunit 4